MAVDDERFSQEPRPGPRSAGRAEQRDHQPQSPAEIKARGTARAVTEQDRQERYAAAVRERIGWQPVVGQFTLFVVEVAEFTYIGSEPGTGAQHVARWPSGEEYIRPQLTPTSLGPPRAVSRLLTPDS